MRSAPAVMMPELTAAFGLSAVGVASLVGLFYYGYAPFSLVAGVRMDQLGPRKVVPLGAATVARRRHPVLDGRPDAREHRPLHAGRRRRFRADRRRLSRDNLLAGLARGDPDRRDPDVRDGGRLGRPVRRRPGYRGGPAVGPFWLAMGVIGIPIAVRSSVLIPDRSVDGRGAEGEAWARRSARSERCSSIRSRSCAA